MTSQSKTKTRTRQVLEGHIAILFTSRPAWLRMRLVCNRRDTIKTRGYDLTEHIQTRAKRFTCLRQLGAVLFEEEEEEGDSGPYRGKTAHITLFSALVLRREIAREEITESEGRERTRKRSKY